MNNPLDTLTYRGYDIDIHHDDDAESPREWDNLGSMACFHDKYTLGDPDAYDNLITYCAKHDHRFNQIWNNEHQSIHWDNDLYEIGQRTLVIETAEKLGCVILPLYLYDHGGITMSTSAFSCPWDSGMVGFIYITPEQIREEWSVKRINKQLREKVNKCLVDEVATYDNYITGAVYRYIIETTNDSCSGFYGYDHKASGLLDYAHDIIDWDIAETRRARLAKLKALILSRVPLDKREALLS